MNRLHTSVWLAVWLFGLLVLAYSAMTLQQWVTVQVMHTFQQHYSLYLYGLNMVIGAYLSLLFIKRSVRFHASMFFVVFVPSFILLLVQYRYLPQLPFNRDLLSIVCGLSLMLSMFRRKAASR